MKPCSWPVEPGARVTHKRCGKGTVIKWKSSPYCSNDWKDEDHVVMVSLDSPPDNWAKVVQLDADNLMLLEKGE